MSSHFTRALTVTSADIDVLGHAGNQVYLRWLLDAAEAHSAHVGFDFARYRELGGVFVVRRHELDYLGSAYAGDELRVETWIARTTRVTSTRAYTISRAETCLMRAQTQWAFVDLASGRPTRIPPEIIAAFSIDAGG